MDVVVDAQLLCWYYQECELAQNPPCTTSPSTLFARLGSQDVGILDSEQMIEAEWRRVVDPDWFDAWLSERFELGDIVEIATDTCKLLLRELRTKCGFPSTSGDKWYVRTAKTRADQSDGKVALVTEDLDFFEPKAKGRGAKARKRHLDACSGCAAKCLKGDGVLVRTALRHVS